MLKQEHTEERIVEAMRKGAALVFHCRGSYSWGDTQT